MVAVRCRAARNRARQVAGHDQVRIGAARAHLRPLAERIDTARPHVADVATQPELAESAERLQVVVTVPHGLGAQFFREDQHFPRGGVGGAVLRIRHFLHSPSSPAMRSISR